MGSSLASALANIFMGFYESKGLNEYNLNKPKFYLRYMDDVLAAFDNEQDRLNFFNILSNRHPNIKLTIEKQINYSIVFLMYSFQLSIIKILRFKHIANRHIQDFSYILMVLHHFHIRLV